MELWSVPLERNSEEKIVSHPDPGVFSSYLWNIKLNSKSNWEIIYQTGINKLVLCHSSSLHFACKGIYAEYRYPNSTKLS